MLVVRCIHVSSARLEVVSGESFAGKELARKLETDDYPRPTS